jgi:hypothetical protein
MKTGLNSKERIEFAFKIGLVVSICLYLYDNGFRAAGWIYIADRIGLFVSTLGLVIMSLAGLRRAQSPKH